MAELKTTPSDKSVEQFLASISDQQQREDATTLCKLMQAATGQAPRMWGGSIVGFGSYHYRYASGREGDWLATGFSPRKRQLTLYLMDGADTYSALLEKLGPHSTAKSCLYIKKLAEVDRAVLKDIIHRSFVAVTASGFQMNS